MDIKIIDWSELCRLSRLCTNQLDAGAPLDKLLIGEHSDDCRMWNCQGQPEQFGSHYVWDCWAEDQVRAVCWRSVSHNGQLVARRWYPAGGGALWHVDYIQIGERRSEYADYFVGLRDHSANVDDEPQNRAEKPSDLGS